MTTHVRSSLSGKVLLFQLLYTSVDSVEKRLVGSGGTITIKCKDFTLIYLDIPTAEDCLNVGTSIEQLSNIGKIFKCLRSAKTVCTRAPDKVGF